MSQQQISSDADEGMMSFWEHLDVLRSVIIRMVVAVAALSIAAFCMKDWLFSLVLWPTHSDFPTYQWLGAPPFRLHLINTELTEQFMIHMRVAIVAGIMAASPYLLYELFSFVTPALYERERRASVQVVLWAYIMFVVGVAVNYILVLPLTVRFLGEYSVSTDVESLISLTSYVDTMLMLCLVFGIVFEIPVVSWLLARFGLLRAEWMTRYRRHAIVVILIAAAILTPTTDAMTLLIVSLPIWMLYEVSIWIVKMKTLPPA